MNSVKQQRPTWLSLLMILAVLCGVGVLLLFAGFALLTLSENDWMTGMWNLLTVVAEGYALYRVTSAYIGTGPDSAVVLWTLVVAIGIPLVAFGGCAVIPSTLRIAG